MFKAYAKFWKNYTNFKDTATRPDYWWVFLINAIIEIVLVIISTVISTAAEAPLRTELLNNSIDTSTFVSMVQKTLMHNTGYLALTGVRTLWALIILVPTAALMARRLRDAVYPWWLAVIGGAFSLLSTILSIVSFASGQSGVVGLILSAVAAIYALVVGIILCAQPTRDPDDV